jgi:hypothetical protein
MLAQFKSLGSPSSMFTYMGQCYRAFDGFYSLDTSDKALMQFVEGHVLIEPVEKPKTEKTKIEIKSEK